MAPKENESSKLFKHFGFPRGTAEEIPVTLNYDVLAEIMGKTEWLGERKHATVTHKQTIDWLNANLGSSQCTAFKDNKNGGVDLTIPGEYRQYLEQYGDDMEAFIESLLMRQIPSSEKPNLNAFTQRIILEAGSPYFTMGRNGDVTITMSKKEFLGKNPEAKGKTPIVEQLGFSIESVPEDGTVFDIVAGVRKSAEDNLKNLFSPEGDSEGLNATIHYVTLNSIESVQIVVDLQKDIAHRVRMASDLSWQGYER